ncbi:trifunctional serine/threonine-protein kinase/ATP-binding protein/sensor histidine kinase [Pseudomonas matsuisoli]|uniref:histidine kinase n=1 Tax=Pseudomonas matsuisoli TaxID=1515666 RepID=A0A917PQC4_9PSED|nr:AAA family ATPase [Pseudomonas matsuisoli]GGJ87698.1 signal transduction histidine kinase [Pseudomonas matsuisoli]
MAMTRGPDNRPLYRLDFSGEWPKCASRIAVDNINGLHRWRAFDERTGRSWMLVAPESAQVNDPRLDREFALAPRLSAEWAVVPQALLLTPQGQMLVLDDEDSVPLSTMRASTIQAEQFFTLAISAAAALNDVHQAGMVHRDIQPANLLCRADGVVRITGFAFASVKGQPLGTASEVGSSSLAYLAPELANCGYESATIRSDLYALGITLFELATGTRPFEAEDAPGWLHAHLAIPPPLMKSLRADLPACVEPLVGRLICKQPGLRYASALELEADLRRCFDDWQEADAATAGEARGDGGKISSLVGRAQESRDLQHALTRLLDGKGGIVLVHGEAGVGKTSLVSAGFADHGHRYLYAMSKCKALGYANPYGFLASAISSLCTSLCSGVPYGRSYWAPRLRAAVGEYGGAVTRLMPELELITGPLRSEIAPRISETRRHLHGTLLSVLQAIATEDHPLVLFLDDLQWADAESLTFLRELDADLFKHVLLVIAYRSDAVAPGTDIDRYLRHCRALPCWMQDISLGPIDGGTIAALLMTDPSLSAIERDRLHARLSQEGAVNPLYLSQAIAAIRENATVADTSLGVMSSLMDLRFAHLPTKTMDVLEKLALLGNETGLEELACACDATGRSLRMWLKPALAAGLIAEHRTGLSFTHDSIWEALLARLSQASIQAMHLEFAIRFTQAVAEDRQPKRVHRAASHVLRVPADAFDGCCHETLVELLIEAAYQARGRVAATVALDYLEYAQRLQPDITTGDGDRACGLRIVYGQCLILDAAYEAADRYINEHLAQTKRFDHCADLYRLRCEICSLQGNYRAALDSIRSGIATLAPDISLTLERPAADRLGRAVNDLIGPNPKNRFAALQYLDDDQVQAVIDLLRAIIVPGSFVEPDLMLIASSHIVRLTLEYGISAAGVEGLAWFGVCMAHHHGLYDQASAYTELAADLSEQSRFAKVRGAALIALERTSVWTKPLPYALECAESAHRFLIAKGSPSFACYANNHIISDLLVLGAPIERMLRQIDTGLKYAKHLEFTDAQSILYTQALYIRRLAGEFSDSIPTPSPAELEKRVARSQMAELRFLWELFEGLFQFLEGALSSASRHLDNAWELSWSAPVHIHLIDLALFTVLNRAALQTQTGVIQDFERPMQRLQSAADTNPRYFGDRLALAKGEIQRIEGNHLQALLHYEDAIDKAGACGAIHIQGLGHELESRCLALVNMHYGARVHLRLARDAWRRWGAKRLADRLEMLNPALRDAPQLAPTLALPGKSELDVLAITKACQALSREIEPEALIKTLLSNATTHAGATFTALLLVAEGRLSIEATGVARPSGIEINLRDDLPHNTAVSMSVVQHVMEHREPLAMNGTEALRRFSQDPYLLDLERGSVGCIPLLKQNAVIGLLYLENALIPGIFEPARVDVLELLAAQAAISLSNARLYSDLSAENERRRASEDTLRRTQALMALGQAVNRYGTFAWKPCEAASLWSDRLLDQVGLPLPENKEYLVDPTGLVHPDERTLFAGRLSHIVTAHEPFRLTFRTVALGGSCHYLELAGEPDDAGDGFIGVLLDITDRTQTEIALRAARGELERTSQASILGELAASIAHEINQPLASILSNAGASIRWLDRETPEVDDALEGIRDIVSEGKRAAEIVNAMRSLARQAPPQCKRFAVDRMIHDVLSLTKADIQDQNVSLVLDIAPAINAWGDPTQIQQVVRNLITNAVEAMQHLPPLTRRLCLSAHSMGDEILVIVQDSGPGVSPSAEDQVFQAFYTNKPTGMGMGLAICWSIISAHGGSLRFTRGRRGESLFFFTLPLATDDATCR